MPAVLLVPEQRAGLRMQRQQMRVAADEEHPIAQHCNAAIAIMPFRLNVFVVPDFAPGAGIQRVNFVGVADIHHTIHHQRRALQALGIFHVVDPLRHQVAHIGRVDLLQQTMAPGGEIAGIAQPVFGGQLQQVLECHFSLQGQHQQKQQQHNLQAEHACWMRNAKQPITAWRSPSPPAPRPRWGEGSQLLVRIVQENQGP